MAYCLTDNTYVRVIYYDTQNFTSGKSLSFFFSSDKWISYCGAKVPTNFFIISLLRARETPTIKRMYAAIIKPHAQPFIRTIFVNHRGALYNNARNKPAELQNATMDFNNKTLSALNRPFVRRY